MTLLSILISKAISQKLLIRYYDFKIINFYIIKGYAFINVNTFSLGAENVR